MAGKTGWIKHDLDLGKAGKMLREYAVTCNGDPLEAFAYFDRKGRHRRVSARYADGWSLQLNFDLQGRIFSYSIGCSLRAAVTA